MIPRDEPGEDGAITDTAPAGRFDASAVLEHMADGFLAVDEDWACIFVNRAIERLFGCDRSALLGQDYWRSALSLRGTPAEAVLRRVSATGEVASLEITFGDRILGLRVYPLPSRGVAVRMRDLTAQRRADETLRLALDTTGIGVWEYGIGSRRFELDPRVAELLALAPQPPTPAHHVVPRRAFYRRILADDRRRVLAACAAATRADAPPRFEVEYRIAVPGGAPEGAPGSEDVRTLLSHGRVLRDGDGRPTRLIGTVLDITERRRTDDQLRRNEERLRLAMGATNLGTLDHDLRTDRREWSEAVHRLVGLPPDAVESRALLASLLHPDDLEPTLAARTRALNPAGDGEYHAEFRIRRVTDGAERWLAMHGRVLFDPHRQPIRSIGILRDITDAKRTEATLRQMNEALEARVEQRTRELEQAIRELSAERSRLGAIIEHLPFGVIVVTRAGAVAFHNAAARQLTGRDFAAVRGWEDFAPFGAVDTAGVPLGIADYALFQATHEGRIVRGRLQSLRLEDGRMRTLSLTSGPVRNERGDIVLGVVAVEDVTQRLETEDALRRAHRLEAIGQLTGGVAHDFNNLLTAIRGNLEMLGRRVEEPRARRLVENATRATDRGADLTGQLLAFARKQWLQPQPVEVNALAASLSDLLGSTLGFAIATEFQLDASPAWALADPTQLELVILNLAINARDAMPDGGTVSIQTRREHVAQALAPEGPPAGDFVTLSVRDTGCGMPPEVMARAFEPFFTTKDIGKGSGLGLAQVLGVVQQMGGGVRLESRPGAGTRVDIFLPQTAAPDAVDAASEASPAPSLAGIAILLVDDDPDVRESTAALLQEFGASVAEASTGAEALAALGPAIDAMLVDFAMPEMNGLEIAAAARRDRPGLPVLLVTGYADDFAASGDIAVLRKPFQAVQLVAAVRACVGRAAEGGG